MIGYDDAVQVLQKLKENAESFDRNEDSVFADYRGVASHDMREIIETLLRLDLNGEILGPGETKEGPLIGALRRLKDSAEIFDKYEDDYIEDYRNMAESEKRDIVETLLELDLDGTGVKTIPVVKSEVAEPVSAGKEETQPVEAEAFRECMLNCDWIIDHAREIKALLSYNSVEMVKLNGVRASCDVDTMMAALKDVGAFIEEIVSPAKPLGAVLADATSRASKSEISRGEKDMGIG